MKNLKQQFKQQWTKVKDLKPGMKIAVPCNEALDKHFPMGSFDNAKIGERENDILWDEIASIKKVGRERVYDIEVEGTHNFVAGHIIRPAADVEDRLSKPPDTIQPWVALTPEEEQKILSSKKDKGTGDQLQQLRKQHRQRVVFGGIFAHNTYLAGNATTTGYLEVGSPTGSPSAGDVNISGTYKTNGGADYAEYFYTDDIDLQPGEAVSVDVTKENAVKRTERAADGNIMGIVSSNPAVVGNGKLWNQNSVIIGLIGQVPAKVSDENGEIRPGDSLTSSSIPGVLMKANAGDSTVGVALESAEERGLDVDGRGQINVLISRRNKSLTVEQVEEQITQRVADMEIEDEVNILIANAMKGLGVEEKLEELVLKVVDLESQIKSEVKEFGQVKIRGELSANGNVKVAGDAEILGNIKMASASEISFGDIVIKGEQSNESDKIIVGTRRGVFTDQNKTASSSLEMLVQGDIQADKAKLDEIILKLAPDSTWSQDVATQQDGDRLAPVSDWSQDVKTQQDGSSQETGANTGTSSEVRITVIETNTGDVKLTVDAGAEFQGNVVVRDLVVEGKLVVYDQAMFMDDVKLYANLELSGAIVQKFYAAPGEFLNIGDAVYVAGDNIVARAYADDIEFKPAIGIAVEIGEQESTASEQEVIVKVAIGGSVKGFQGLTPGDRYYLSDLMHYIDNFDTGQSILPASLSRKIPGSLGAAIQILAIAKSSSELLIMPSLNYERVDESNYDEYVNENLDAAPLSSNANAAQEIEEVKLDDSELGESEADEPVITEIEELDDVEEQELSEPEVIVVDEPMNAENVESPESAESLEGPESAETAEEAAGSEQVIEIEESTVEE